MKTIKFFAALCCVAAIFAACEPQNGTESGYEWVDLGLSVKWATCNVGASKPEAYGNYYAWGETTIKNSYTESNYQYYSDPITLPLNRDAAHVNMGGNWRMPTHAEWLELIEQCTWEWRSNYGGTTTSGYLVTSEKNGNSIFLPAAGMRDSFDLAFKNEVGGYWSSSPATEESEDVVWILACDQDDWFDGVNVRYTGLTVRPVCE
ncbi:MAG: hypothetical protein ACI30H_02415 [Paludibacteraceae bacterium]